MRYLSKANENATAMPGGSVLYGFEAVSAA